MAHDLTTIDGSFARSMYARVRTQRDVPWHGHGIQGETDESIDAISRRLILPHVTILPAYYLIQGQPVQADDYRLIVGALPDAEGPYTSPAGTRYRRDVHGTVKGQYHLYTPQYFVDDFASSVPVPCETMGLLKNGATLFITVKLPSFGVKGDELEPYLMGASTTDGVTSVQCRITPVRVVCQNTLSMALAKTTEQAIAITHASDPSPRVRAFLRECWEASTTRVAVIQEACELLASRAVTGQTLEEITATIYPTTPLPDAATTSELLTDSEALTFLAEWERQNKYQLAHRESVATLFESSPTRTAATTGNLWGLYQAVTEYEDHYKSRSTSLSRFVGEARKRKEKAFDLCLTLAHS